VRSDVPRSHGVGGTKRPLIRLLGLLNKHNRGSPPNPNTQWNIEICLPQWGV